MTKEAVRIRRSATVDNEFGVRLLKALGLEGKSVTSITINLQAGTLVTVDLTMLVHDEQKNLILEEFEDATIEILEEFRWPKL